MSLTSIYHCRPSQSGGERGGWSGGKESGGGGGGGDGDGLGESGSWGMMWC